MSNRPRSRRLSTLATSLLADNSFDPLSLSLSPSPILKLSPQRAPRLHLDFRTGGDDDDLPVGRPIFGAVIFHVVERHCLVVPGDGVRRTVAVLISAIVSL